MAQYESPPPSRDMTQVDSVSAVLDLVEEAKSSGKKHNMHGRNRRKKLNREEVRQSQREREREREKCVVLGGASLAFYLCCLFSHDTHSHATMSYLSVSVRENKRTNKQQPGGGT